MTKSGLWGKKNPIWILFLAVYGWIKTSDQLHLSTKCKPMELVLNAFGLSSFYENHETKGWMDCHGAQQECFFLKILSDGLLYLPVKVLVF